MGIINLEPAVQLILIPVIVFALSFHEYAHGWVAYRKGDPTAYHAGRLTMNPLAHLDPFGALAIYFVGFGWAKPVPVDPRHLSNPRRDMLWIALAGPLSNILLALVSGLLLRLVWQTGLLSSQSPLISVLVVSLQINLALAIFNFLPIPPLDGSRILTGLLPTAQAPLIYQLERYGPMVLMGLILFGMVTGIPIIGTLISPFIHLFMSLFTLGLI